MPVGNDDWDDQDFIGPPLEIPPQGFVPPDPVLPNPPDSTGGSAVPYEEGVGGNFVLPFPLPDNAPIKMSDGSYCFDKDVTICESLDPLQTCSHKDYNPDILVGLTDIITKVSETKVSIFMKIADSIKSIADNVTNIFAPNITNIESKIETIQNQVNQVKTDIQLQIDSKLAPILNEIETIQNVQVPVNVTQSVTTSENAAGGVTVNVTIPADAIKVEAKCELQEKPDDQKVLPIDTPKEPTDTPEETTPEPPSETVSEECPSIDSLKDASNYYWLLSDCGNKYLDEWMEKQGFGEVKNKVGSTIKEAYNKAFALQESVTPPKPNYNKGSQLLLENPLG